MTLLEAVIALAILSAVMIVCLDLRARMLRHTDALQRRQLVEREAQNLYIMASTGSLHDPIVDKQAGAYRWEGEHLGSRYAITAKPVAIPSPTKPSPDAPIATAVQMWRYELAYMGETIEFIRH
jgi:Tfp pilus assembly protein PilV